MTDIVEKLFQQHREEVIKRLDRIEDILQRFLVIEDRVNEQGRDIHRLESDVAELKGKGRVTAYKRDWSDKVVQLLLSGAAVAVMAAAINSFIGA